MPDRVGLQLGNYRLVRLLGQGGFAEVYLGEHIFLKSQAAIKVLYTRLTNEDMEAFLAEARTLVQLVHPHIVRVLDFGMQGDTPFLVMDYAPNGTLRQHHPKGSILPLATIVSYVVQVADALQYAHNMKIIHRDIKPENMLVGRDNEILLSDFGIAIVAQSSRYSVDNQMAGTIAYMAPEQIQSRPRPASDQYALAIVVYEWLSGERPFTGSFTEIAAKHTLTPPPLLREKVPTIQPEVEQILLLALEKDPAKRFANVRAFAEALRQASVGAHDSHAFQALPTSAQPYLFRSSLLTASPLAVDEASQPTFLATPSRQQSGTPERATPMPAFGTPLSPQIPSHNSPQSVPSTTGNPQGQFVPQPQQQKRGRGWIIALVSLFIIGSFLGVLAFSLKSPTNSGPSVTSTPTTTAITTSTSAPTGVSSPTPTQIVYPNMAGYFTGPIHNTYANIDSTMTLSVNQSQGSISGEFTVAPPLSGSGPFTGGIATDSSFQFLVHSTDTQYPILFSGTIQADGSLNGTYCSVNANNQCDTSAGGHGVWSATHS